MRPVLISTGYFFSDTEQGFTPCPLGQALANSDEEVHYFFALLQGWHSKLMLHEYLASTPPRSSTLTSYEIPSLMLRCEWGKKEKGEFLASQGK